MSDTQRARDEPVGGDVDAAAAGGAGAGRSRAFSSADAEQSAKQASCLQCRKIKVKCVRSATATICTRCSNRGTHCTIPDYRVGRRKGVPNKRKGIDKAIHQLEQALQDAKASADSSDETGNTALRLQQLLKEAGAVLNSSEQAGRNPTQSSPYDFPSPSPSQLVGIGATPAPLRQTSAAVNRPVVEDTENPLQLLAHATEHCLPLPNTQPHPNQPAFDPSFLPGIHHHTRDDHILRTFFGAPVVNLDVGPLLDPVNLGLVTLVEAEDLIDYFYQKLAYTRWGLDPAIHTAHFIRQRSAFLFTTVMAASAKFVPAAAALSTRLSAHCRTLANHVTSNRNRSVEIVIAFMFNVPWLPAGKHWDDDEGSSFLVNALNIALDLSLDKVIESSDIHVQQGVAGRDIISARRALALDGFDTVDPTSTMGRRLLRRRERAWLGLFILDRGFCMARERRSLFPVDTPLLQRCNGWYLSDIAADSDRTLISITVIRRDLISLIDQVKRRCDEHQPGVESGITVAEGIRDMIEDFLHGWYAAWAPIVADWKENKLPPYVEILSCHTRLSIYGLVMNHPTAPTDVHGFFRVGGLSASINVMRTAVQGETLWKSVPNNTIIMVAFAACLALRLSNTQPETNPGIAQNVRSLVYQTADVFERVGSSPPHRQGISVLYAMHLRAMVNKYHPEAAAAAAAGGANAAAVMSATQPSASTAAAATWQNDHFTQDVMNNQPLFADMTDVEFSQALKSVESELLATEADISADWWNNLDWLTWDDRVGEQALLL